jgi:hypothetical protein
MMPDAIAPGSLNPNALAPSAMMMLPTLSSGLSCRQSAGDY